MKISILYAWIFAFLIIVYLMWGVANQTLILFVFFSSGVSVGVFALLIRCPTCKKSVFNRSATGINYQLFAPERVCSRCGTVLRGSPELRK